MEHRLAASKTATRSALVAGGPGASVSPPRLCSWPSPRRGSDSRRRTSRRPGPTQRTSWSRRPWLMRHRRRAHSTSTVGSPTGPRGSRSRGPRCRSSPRSFANRKVGFKTLQEIARKTDAEGKFAFTIGPELVANPNLYLVVEAASVGYMKEEGNNGLDVILRNQRRGEKPFFEEMRLRPARPIFGIVLTPEGKPAAGVNVSACSAPEIADNPAMEAKFTETRTDAQGHFSARCVRRRQGRRLLAAPGFRPLGARPGRRRRRRSWHVHAGEGDRPARQSPRRRGETRRRGPRGRRQRGRDAGGQPGFPVRRRRPAPAVRHDGGRRDVRLRALVTRSVRGEARAGLVGPADPPRSQAGRPQAVARRLRSPEDRAG